MKIAFVPNNNILLLQNKRYVKILFKFSEIVGLSLPNLYNYNGLAIWYLAYSLIICLGLIAIWGWTLYGKITYEYSKIIQTAAVLDALIITASTLTNVVSILSTVLLRRRSTVKLVKLLKDIERDIIEKFGIVDPYHNNYLPLRFFCLEFMVINYVIFVSTFDILYKGIIGYSYCCCMYLSVLLVSITINQLQFFSTIIMQSFHISNKKLTETMLAQNNNNHQQSIKKMNKNNSNSNVQNVEMRFFLKLFDRLCDAIDLVNKSYGIQIVFISFVIILCLIESLNLLMKLALGVETTKAWKTYALIADTWSSIIYIIYGIMIAMSCDQTTCEINNTSTVSYKILLDIPTYSKSVQEDITKNELLLLAEHLSQRKIHFSAAGFFNVDHTMLYMIFGSIAAYLVIVLQFN